MLLKRGLCQQIFPKKMKLLFKYLLFWCPRTMQYNDFALKNYFRQHFTVVSRGVLYLILPSLSLKFENLAIRKIANAGTSTVE